ncbi:MAG: UbiA family prenyltransferase [Candidatus Micrarchaeota archaeon]
MNALNAWLRLTRAEHAVMVYAAVTIAQLVVLHGNWNAVNWIAGLGPALITLAAFAINDYFDVESDKALKRTDRPLVSEEINETHALWASIAFFAAGCGLAWLAGDLAFYFVFLYAVFSVAYSWKLKRLPLIGNLFIASAMSVSFLYGNLIVSPVFNNFVLLFIAISFAAGLGRELLITLRDVEGDKKMGATTLPMLIGSKATVVLSSALLHSAVVVSLFPLTEKIFWPYAVLVGISDILFLFAAWRVVLDASPGVLKKARNYTLAALMFGILAFASLAFW